jgi:hypothetical protein
MPHRPRLLLVLFAFLTSIYILTHLSPTNPVYLFLRWHLSSLQHIFSPLKLNLSIPRPYDVQLSQISLIIKTGAVAYPRLRNSLLTLDAWADIGGVAVAGDYTGNFWLEVWNTTEARRCGVVDVLERLFGELGFDDDGPGTTSSINAEDSEGQRRVEIYRDFKEVGRKGQYPTRELEGKG